MLRECKGDIKNCTWQTSLKLSKDLKCLQTRDFLLLGAILWAQNKAGPKTKLSPVPVPPR